MILRSIKRERELRYVQRRIPYFGLFAVILFFCINIQLKLNIYTNVFTY